MDPSTSSAGGGGNPTEAKEEEAKLTEERTDDVKIDAPVPTKRDDKTSKLWEKLQAEGLLTSREVAPRPTPKEKEPMKRLRPVKIELPEPMEEAQTISLMPKKATKRKKPSGEPAEDAKPAEEVVEGEEKKKRKRERSQAASIVCQYQHTHGTEAMCKQRAILGYRFCIRHILQDPDAPYQQCAHHRRPKNKNDTVTRCTNAIRKDSSETFCSTHLIMQGLKEAKKKPQTTTESGRSTPHDGEVSSPGATGRVPSPGTVLSSPLTVEAGGEPHAATLPGIAVVKKDAIPAPPTSQHYHPPPLVKREESHLMRALSSPGAVPAPPVSFPPVRPEVQSTSLLRTVLEHKPEPQKFVLHPPRPIQMPPTTTAPLPIPRNEPPPPVVSQAPPPPPRPLEPRELISRMTPAQRVLFDRFVRARAEKLKNQQKPSPPCPQQQYPHQFQPSSSRPALAPRLPPQRPLIGGRPRKLNPEHIARVDRILSKISPQVRQGWAISLTSRTGVKMLTTQAPFSLGAVQKVNPQLAQRLYQFGKRRFPRVAVRSSQLLDAAKLPQNAPPIRPAPLSSDDEDDDVPPKVIKLRHKGQTRRMVGPYRDIPLLTQACAKLEDGDYDDTDLFPLGMEPSDDELDEIPGPFRSFRPASLGSIADVKDPLSDLYLLRKQLRLERFQLLKTAQANAPLMAATRCFPMAAGAALRQRAESVPAPPEMLINTLRRCSQVENKQRCDRCCLPTANQCSIHVLYNVNQKIFQFCNQSFCRRPVLSVDACIWDGKCRLHRESHLDRYGEYPVYADLELPQARASSRQSSKSESEDEDETDPEDDDLLDGNRGDDFDDDDEGSVGTP